jgi:acyl carrier protein
MRPAGIVAKCQNQAKRFHKNKHAGFKSRLRAGRPVSLDMDIRTEVIVQFKQVAEEQDKELAALTDDLALIDCGLDSLCFAVVVARLENSLGVDPFSTDEDVRFPVTFGDFIGFYENAAQ